MAENPTFIRSLLLQGFRAYLDPRTFDFSKHRCLAVFAPNGFGKSSLIDALEFLFSEKGSLERLGHKASNNNAGPLALAHDLAAGKKIASSVTIEFICGSTSTSGSRTAMGSKRECPLAVSDVIRLFAVTPIIRGYEMRKFVEEESLEQRYASMVNWLQLGPLVDAQRNLRSLRTLIKASAEDTSAFTRIDTQVAKETLQAVKAWTSATVVDHVNSSLLKPLDEALVLTAINAQDAAYTTVQARALAEEKRLGLEGLRQIRHALGALHDAKLDPQTGETISSGLIVAFAQAIASKTATTHALATERAAAADAAFAAMWREAEPLFASSAPPLEDCPICLTAIPNTKAGSSEAIRNHLTSHLASLKGYADAKNADDTADKALTAAHTRLVAGLKTLSLPDEYDAARTIMMAFQADIEAWSSGQTIDHSAVLASIGPALSDVDARISEIVEKQGEHTYVRAKAKLDRLIELADEHALTSRVHKELTGLSEALTAQSNFVSSEIRTKVQALLEGLQSPINAIYKAIQGANAANVRLELPSEDDATQQRLNLLIDFSANRIGVQPGGYLSDSQIHSLALALRLSAIKAFNTAVPIIALDDIVTSYDADHRRTIAALLATEFASHQIIVTTHDEQFYRFLKDQQAVADWRCTRISKLDRDFGPRFTDEKVSDQMIADRWSAGEHAANEMRQAEEEWLLTICREFGVNVRIRQLERAFSYERSELASALASFLTGNKLAVPMVAGVNNRFLNSLQAGVVENFGSHFQEGPYGDGSIGDEKARWAEFVSFRDQFACSSCKRTRFKRPPGLKKPVCNHESCETPFGFAMASDEPKVA